jgi:ubiquinone/menaquinone biosynthesis C-methylase UbiE
MPYNPELYDVATPGALRGDIDWYRRKAREAGGPVLELGAGTGRVTLPIAEDGVSICALDAHPGMLAQMRRKISDLAEDVQRRITVVQADMRDFRLGVTFVLVIVPYRAFLHNVTEDDQLTCLRCVHDHLQPGGRLAFNVFHPSLEYMAQHTGALAGVWRWTATHPLPGGGQLVQSDSIRYDTVQQRVHAQQRYEEYDAEGSLTRTFLHRLELAYLYPVDIRRRLEQAGFDEIQIAGDFTGRPFAHDTDELVVEARRAGQEEGTAGAATGPRLR